MVSNPLLGTQFTAPECTRVQLMYNLTQLIFPTLLMSSISQSSRFIYKNSCDSILAGADISSVRHGMPSEKEIVHTCSTSAKMHMGSYAVSIFSLILRSHLAVFSVILKTHPLFSSDSKDFSEITIVCCPPHSIKPTTLLVSSGLLNLNEQSAQCVHRSPEGCLNSSSSLKKRLITGIQSERYYWHVKGVLSHHRGPEAA